MKEIMLIGKSVLGNEGFSFIPEKMTNEDGKDVFYTQLDKIKEVSSRETIVTTAITSKCDLEEMDYDYLPTVLLYNNGFRNLVDPGTIYMNVINKTDSCTPNVDFLVWDSKINPLTAVTYSKTAPIIYMESKNGMCCLGVILRKALINHGIYTFEKILKCMNADKENPVELVIASSTDFHYEDMGSTIYEYIQTFVLDMKEISSCRFLYNVDISNECYKAEEKGNHVILIK